MIKHFCVHVISWLPNHLIIGFAIIVPPLSTFVVFISPSIIHVTNLPIISNYIGHEFHIAGETYIWIYFSRLNLVLTNLANILIYIYI